MAIGENPSFLGDGFFFGTNFRPGTIPRKRRPSAGDRCCRLETPPWRAAGPAAPTV